MYTPLLKHHWILSPPTLPWWLFDINLILHFNRIQYLISAKIIANGRIPEPHILYHFLSNKGFRWFISIRRILSLLFNYLVSVAAGWPSIRKPSFVLPWPFAYITPRVIARPNDSSLTNMVIRWRLTIQILITIYIFPLQFLPQFREYTTLPPTWLSDISVIRQVWPSSFRLAQTDKIVFGHFYKYLTHHKSL